MEALGARIEAKEVDLKLGTATATAFLSLALAGAALGATASGGRYTAKKGSGGDQIFVRASVVGKKHDRFELEMLRDRCAFVAIVFGTYGADFKISRGRFGGTTGSHTNPLGTWKVSVSGRVLSRKRIRLTTRTSSAGGPGRGACAGDRQTWTLARG